MKSVIFDLDGTLADTSGDLIASANHCLSAFGPKALLDPRKDGRFAFAGGRAMLQEGLSRIALDAGQKDALVEENFPKLIAYYGEHIDTYTRVYAGVEPCLEVLLERGYKLGVCTNKPEGLAVSLMARLGLDRFFGALLGADSLPVRKPDPLHLWATIDALGADRKRSVLIGDTITDRKTSENAGLPSILVRFGPEGSQVDALKPQASFDHYKDLPDLVDRWVS